MLCWQSCLTQSRPNLCGLAGACEQEHSLRSRRYEINGSKKERAPARRTVRPFFLAPTYFLAPATQAKKNTETLIHFSSGGDLFLTGKKRIFTHNLCDVTITYLMLSDT